MKTAIIYCSKHNGNTKKVIDAIAAEFDVDLYSSLEGEVPDLSAYDLIGFASGVYCERVDGSILRIAKNALPDGKKTFVIITCGSVNERYARSIVEIAESKDCQTLGVYSCTGYYNLAPFKWSKGKRIGHPSEEEIRGAIEFYQNLTGYRR